MQFFPRPQLTENEMKSYTIIFVTFLLFGSFVTKSAIAAYADTVLADGPVAFWRLDESSGSTAVNLGTLGSSANASYSGGHSKGQSPLISGDGTSVDFSGGNVTPGSTNGISSGGPFTEKTIELWFKADSLSGRQVLYEQGGGTRGLAVYLDGNTLYVAGWNRANDDGGGAAAPWGSPAPVYVSSGTSISTDTVYHVVLVMDGDTSGTGGTIEGFLNGQSFGQAAGVGRLWNHNPAVIGNATGGIRFHDNNTLTNNRDFDGNIDEVALYNTALSSAQVQQHYQAGAGGSSDLVGHWKLNENSGTDAADDSGSGNDGELFGVFSFDLDSVASCPTDGSALRFNGTDDYIAVPDSNSLDITDALTIAGWVHADSWGAGFNVDVIARKGSDGPNSYQLAVADKKVTLLLDDSDGGGIQGKTRLSKDAWYHVAATWDGSEVRIYVNGSLDMDAAASWSGTLSTDSRDLYIGGQPGGDFFDGILDDIRIYNRALSSSEVAALYGLRAHWKLDEEFGSTAADATGGGNDGT
ncbi:MAG: LamG domain-containing protein, partial [Planctomycetales bacterium]|nr:LamG domain-containing protein [Planctomycetales bacterium]